MIGQKSFEIDASDFVRGMSSSNFINDGGWSPSTFGINPATVPGLLYGPGAITDQTDELVDTNIGLLASCEDISRNASASVRLFVDSGGNYYRWNGTLLDYIHTDASSPTKYSPAIVDMIGFGVTADTFTTNEVKIVRWLFDDSFNDSFATFTYSTVPHPALVFENNAFFGDGNLLLRTTDPTVAPTTILDLGGEKTIVALGIDPGSGRMLISYIDGVNITDTKNRISRVGYYDGYSNKLLKTVLVDDMITAFYPVSASLYITYGLNLGYWTGAGIEFIRALNISQTSAGLAYKQNITNVGTTLFVIEGAKMLAFGNIIRGQAPVPYYVFENIDVVTATSMLMVCNLGSGLLGYGWIDSNTVPHFYTYNTADTTNLGQAVPWRTNKYTFKRPVTFNAIVIEYGVALTASNVGVASILNSNQTQTFFNFGISSTDALNGNPYEAFLPYPTMSPTRSIQLSYSYILQTPIRRITVYYSDDEEQT